jgi:TPR repeat protein
MQVMLEAWYWLKASASKGHAAACCALGDLALEGFDSLETSPSSAIHWYQQASALGACALMQTSKGQLLHQRFAMACHK